MYGQDSFEQSAGLHPRLQNLRSIRFLAPLFSQTCARSFPQTLSFDRLSQNTRGEGWVYSLANICSPDLAPNSLLTPFPGTLTGKFTIRRKHVFLTRLDTTLTDTPSHKSFIYHSYEKSTGVGVPPSRRNSKLEFRASRRYSAPLCYHSRLVYVDHRREGE